MQDRRPYYVSVGKQEVLTDGEDANFEFEILATEEEARELMEMFADSEGTDEGLISRAQTPYESFEDTPNGKQDLKNEPYDESLQAIYRFLHRLGTPETKRHIEKMNIL